MAKRGKKIPEKLARRAKQIQVLLMDVDGTLTDGSVMLLSNRTVQRSRSRLLTRTMVRDSHWPLRRAADRR